MLNSEYILLFGLNDSQIKKLYESSDGLLVPNFIIASSYKQIIKDHYCAVIINCNELKGHEFKKVNQFFLEADGNSTKKIALNSLKDKYNLNNSIHIVYEDFENELPYIIKIIDKAYKAAKKIENTAHNVLNIMNINKLLKKQNFTTKELVKKIGCNQAAIKRYIEILCLVDINISYNYEEKIWKLYD